MAKYMDIKQVGEVKICILIALLEAKSKQKLPIESKELKKKARSYINGKGGGDWSRSYWNRHLRELEAIQVIERENKRRRTYINLRTGFETVLSELLYTLVEKDKKDLITFFLMNTPFEEAKNYFEDIDYYLQQKSKGVTNEELKILTNHILSAFTDLSQSAIAWYYAKRTEKREDAIIQFATLYVDLKNIISLAENFLKTAKKLNVKIQQTQQYFYHQTKKIIMKELFTNPIFLKILSDKNVKMQIATLEQSQDIKDIQQTWIIESLSGKRSFADLQTLRYVLFFE